jgi:hypothetical protein
MTQDFRQDWEIPRWWETVREREPIAFGIVRIHCEVPVEKRLPANSGVHDRYGAGVELIARRAAT